MPNRRKKRKQRDVKDSTARGSNRLGDGLPWLPVPIIGGALLCCLIAANLHHPWIGFAWLTALALWGYHYWLPCAAQYRLSRLFFVRLSLVILAAACARWVKISDLPIGPSADEIFTLNNTIDLLHKPFDLFGHTSLFVDGWVETANLYLYSNLLVVQLFGANYWSMKLFSVYPGVIAAGAVFLIGRLIIDERAAFWTALLFAFAHWPIRLGRYGWDVSFMVMGFAVAMWLLLEALRSRQLFYAYLSGITAGICLYSYLGARACVFSLLVFLIWQRVVNREELPAGSGTAFSIGAVLAAFPLLMYYLAHPRPFWIRTAELSVFNSTAPLLEIIDNLWRHGLMFFAQGGVYARDNYPGLPMLDPVAGILLVIGTFLLLRRNSPAARLILCTVGINFAPGIFSMSPEGAPYVYRTAAVVVPTFLIVGMGLQWVTARCQEYGSQRIATLGAWSLVLAIAGVNMYYYFGLEAKNGAAMRVMAYAPRLLGLEAGRDDLPVYFVGAEIFDLGERLEITERYAAANRPIILPLEIQKLAVITFSGRYDRRRTLSDNFAKPNNLYFVSNSAFDFTTISSPDRAKIIFSSADKNIREAIMKRHSNALMTNLLDIWGKPMFTVALIKSPIADALQ